MIQQATPERPSPTRYEVRRTGRLPARLATSLAVALIALAAAGQEAGDTAATGEPFTGSAEVTVVEVPVQVVHRGEPVRELTAADFRVFDEGEERKITSFERLDLAGGIPAAPDRSTSPAQDPPPAALRRHFLVLFDLAFSRPEDLIRVEAAARHMVREQVAPSDLVGVAFYSPRRGASMVLRFTSDHAQVLGVLDAFRGLLEGRGVPPEPAGERRGDPLGITASTPDAVLADVGRAAGIESSLMEQAIAWGGPYGGLGGGLELNKMLNTVWSTDQQIRDRRGGKIVDLSRSIASLAQEAAGVSGIKYLVLFSRGFSVEVLQTKTVESPFPGAAGAAFAVGGGSWVINEVDAMLEELRRQGWAIHAVELDGVGAITNWNFREGLFFLAEETGGALYENTNDPAESLGRMMERTAVTYLLSFQVDDLPPEPAFRRLRVEVDGIPRRATVVHRAGYEQPGPWWKAAPGHRRAVSAEALLAGADRDALGLRILALPRRNGTDGWRVPVALEVEGMALLSGPVEQVPGAEIYAYAFAADGAVVDLLAHRIVFSEPDARGRLVERGLKFLGDLELPADGSYRVRFLVRSLRSGETALHTVPLDLPRDGRPVLLPPVLVERLVESPPPAAEAEPAAQTTARTAGGWIVTDEVTTEGSPPPFTVHGREVVPAVGAVGPGARILILGYDLGGAAAGFRATLAGPDGSSPDAPTFLARAPGEGSEPDLLIAELPEGVPPGVYTLSVAVTGADGTVRGRTGTRFEVHPER